MDKCRWADGLSILPDGVHELDACVYDEVERYRNVTVSVLRCRRCGHEEIVWYRQTDTEEVEADESEID